MLPVSRLLCEPVTDIVAFLVELLMPNMSILSVRGECGRIFEAHTAISASERESNVATLETRQVQIAYVYIF